MIKSGKVISSWRITQYDSKCPHCCQEGNEFTLDDIQYTDHIQCWNCANDFIPDLEGYDKRRQHEENGL